MVEFSSDFFTSFDIVQLTVGVFLTQVVLFASPTTPPSIQNGLILFVLAVSSIFIFMDRLSGVRSKTIRIGYYIGISVGVASVLGVIFAGNTVSMVVNNPVGVFGTQTGLAITIGVIGAFALDILGAL